jgi:hypothetical protein
MSTSNNRIKSDATRRRRSHAEDKAGCFVGVVNLDQLTATNGASLPRRLCTAHGDFPYAQGGYNGMNSIALLQHALPIPDTSNRRSSNDCELPSIGGRAYSGRASSMPAFPPTSMNQIHSHEPYDVEPPVLTLSGVSSMRGEAYSGRASSMPAIPSTAMSQNHYHEPQPYGVPSNSAYVSAPVHRSDSASMVTMGPMLMYEDAPNQNGKRPSKATCVSMPMPGQVQHSSKRAKISTSTSTKGERQKKRWTWKKPEGMPKRPLSAYNL